MDGSRPLCRRLRTPRRRALSLRGRRSGYSAPFKAHVRRRLCPERRKSAPTATQGAQRNQPHRSTAQIPKAANCQALEVCCPSRCAPSQCANLLGKLLGGSGRTNGPTPRSSMILLMVWFLAPVPPGLFFACGSGAQSAGSVMQPSSSAQPP